MVNITQTHFVWRCIKNKLALYDKDPFEVVNRSSIDVS